MTKEQSTSEKNAIELKNVHLTLGEGASEVHILKGLDLRVPQGQSVGIVGPSGAGKSSLLMVMAGLERIDQGSITMQGTDFNALSEDELAKFRGQNFGIVFQSFHLIPNMTALENVAVPLELAGVKDSFERATAELEAVGLGKRLSHFPTELSGGEQQRVALARALAPRPKIIIADEPTGNLDGNTGDQIADLLFSQQEKHNVTLILVTHDPSLAERCQRTISVNSGRLDDSHALDGAA